MADSVVPNSAQDFRGRGWPLWLVAVILLLTVFNGIPFLAPVFMKLGWEGVGRGIYLAYSPMCHQMAQRSFFLFGPQGFQMHNIAELPVNLADLSGGARLLALRRFVGSEALGWKVAWSDRMVYMYVTPLLVAVVYGIVRQFRRVSPLPLWLFAVLLLPMAIDGGTHWVSDLAGVGSGFRYTNEWLAALTGGVFPQSFYVGDAFGSFNSWMRLLSGVTFGIGVGWLFYPHLDRASQEPAGQPSADGWQQPVSPTIAHQDS